jgi:predicted Zn-dependent protease
MKKISLHFSILTVSFFLVWLILSRIDFRSMLNVEGFSRENEQKLTEIILETVKQQHDESGSDSLKSIVRAVARRVCDSIGVTADSLTIVIMNNDEVNAFALPGRTMLVNTGLIQYCRSAEELAGVIAHEVGHMEKEHVTRKLIKEFGVAMLSTIIGGNSNRELLAELAKVISSSAYDREQERDADLFAVRALAAADIDPEHLSNFLFRLSREKGDVPRGMEWVSTHPDSKDRAAAVMTLRKEQSFRSVPIFSSPWEDLKQQQ